MEMCSGIKRLGRVSPSVRNSLLGDVQICAFSVPLVGWDERDRTLPSKENGTSYLTFQLIYEHL